MRDNEAGFTVSIHEQQRSALKQALESRDAVDLAAIHFENDVARAENVVGMVTTAA